MRPLPVLGDRIPHRAIEPSAGKGGGSCCSLNGRASAKGALAITSCCGNCKGSGACWRSRYRSMLEEQIQEHAGGADTADLVQSVLEQPDVLGAHVRAVPERASKKHGK
eukprot:768696-Hanusia_phi.AAC.3